MKRRAKIKARKIRAKKVNSVSRIRKPDYSDPFSSPVDQILYFQRTIGNQRLQKFFKSDVVQAKLNIKKTNDMNELEPDRKTESIMYVPESQLKQETKKAHKLHSNSPWINEAKEEEKRGEAYKVNPEIDVQIKSLQSLGVPLEPKLRAEMEDVFDHDFRDVRIHEDTAANELVDIFGAKAFTAGKDIFLHSTILGPKSSTNMGILKHELAHVAENEKEKRIRFWWPSEHGKLTRTNARGNVPPGWVNMLAQKSASMDKRKERLLKVAPHWALKKLRLIKSYAEGPEHGEGGDYKIEPKNVGAARKLNVALQNQRISRAVNYYNQWKSYQIRLYLTRRRLKRIIALRRHRISPKVIRQFPYQITKIPFPTRARRYHPLLAYRRVDFYEKQLKYQIGNMEVLSRRTFERLASYLGDALHIAQDRGAHWEGVKTKGHDDPREKSGKWSADNPKDNFLGHIFAKWHTRSVFARFKRLTGI